MGWVVGCGVRFPFPFPPLSLSVLCVGACGTITRSIPSFQSPWTNKPPPPSHDLTTTAHHPPTTTANNTQRQPPGTPGGGGQHSFLEPHHPTPAPSTVDILLDDGPPHSRHGKGSHSFQLPERRERDTEAAEVASRGGAPTSPYTFPNVGTEPVLAGHGMGLPLSRIYARYFGGDLEVRRGEACWWGAVSLLCTKIRRRAWMDAAPVHF